jgi:hypothetical protein
MQRSPRHSLYVKRYPFRSFWLGATFNLSTEHIQRAPIFFHFTSSINLTHTHLRSSLLPLFTLFPSSPRSPRLVLPAPGPSHIERSSIIDIALNHRSHRLQSQPSHDNLPTILPRLQPPQFVRLRLLSVKVLRR